MTEAVTAARAGTRAQGGHPTGAAGTRPPGAAPERTGTRPGLGHVPGLDGIRAVALLAVMGFHHGSPVARGGYLGVSAFFTLSGFLITSLALDERHRTGRLSWRRFWERRARRLLPAALLTLTAVLVLQGWAEIGTGLRARGDVLAALGYVANWRLAGAPGGYAASFSDPSPVVHFWSLAIEEQFYVLFPFAFTAVMAVASARLRRGGVAFAVAAAASFTVAWLLADGEASRGIVYYGTHTRAGELLVGVVLAFAAAEWRARRAAPSAARTGPPGRWSRWARRSRLVPTVAGIAAVAGLTVLWTRVPIGDDRLFRGVTLLNALLTAVVISACVGGGPVDRVLGARPLAAIGLVSYGAYLFHWPIYLVLTPERVGVDGAALFALRLALTLGLATVSYFVVETPFRYRLRVPLPRLAAVGAAAVAVVVSVALAVPQRPTAMEAMIVPVTGGVEPAAGGGGGDPSAAGGGAVPLAAGGGREPARREVLPSNGTGMQANTRMLGAVVPEDGTAGLGTVLVAGDSVSWSLLFGFAGWNDEHPKRALQVDTHIAFGCPIGGAAEPVHLLREEHTPFGCQNWHDTLGQILDRSAPDAVVFVMGLADLGGRRIDGEWRDPGDPVYDTWLTQRINLVAATLTRRGAPVVWLTYPPVKAQDPDDPTRPAEDIRINEPARVERYNEVLRAALVGHPGIRVVDLARWADDGLPGKAFDRRWTDGVHFTPEGSALVANWLIPQVLALLPS